jgi:hypothetical protein
MSNGGYERKKAETFARRTTATEVGTEFEPLVSIRLAPGREFAVVVPRQFIALPTSLDSFEIALIKNATLTGAGFTAIPDSTTGNVQYDTSATAMSGGQIVDIRYTVSSNQSTSQIAADVGYNWALQLGTTQAGVSDIYTVAARVLSGTGDIIGSLGFYDLT